MVNQAHTTQSSNAYRLAAVILVLVTSFVGVNFVLIPKLAVGVVRSSAMTTTKLPVRSKPRIVLFGDSLTERSFNPAGGWGAALADYYSRKADIVVRGFGGYNTRWSLHLLRDVFPAAASQQVPMLATVFFGANDAAIAGKMCDFQHVALAEYKENLKQLVSGIRSAGVTRIVLITPPPVYEPGRLVHQQQIAIRDNKPDANVQDPDRTNSTTGQYAQAAKQVAAELQVPAIDLWTAMTSEEGWESRFLIPDGLHFSTEGNQFVFQQVRATIEEHFPDIRPDELPTHMPTWWEVDAQDPGAIFKSLQN